MRGGNGEGDGVIARCRPIPTLALCSASSVPLPLKGRECLATPPHCTSIARRVSHIYLFLFIFFSNITHAQLPPPVAQALARTRIPETHVAVYVHEIGAAEALIAHRAGESLNPASVMKLVTTYAGLELLGPAFQWSTDLYTDGVLQDDVLTGNLILKGGGDPKFTIENFWLLLRALRAKGVREIRGDLVLDRSLFTTDFPDPGRFDSAPTEPYNTTPDALLANFKTFTLTFAPMVDARGVRITVDPPLPQLQIVNNLTLAEGGCGMWMNRMKVQVQDSGDTARLTFAGPYSRHCGEQASYYSMLGHPAYVAGLFQHLWRELGGTFTGRVREGEANARLIRLASQRSPALSEIVRDINKFSNNVMARQLLLTIGAVAGGAQATPERGARAVLQFFGSKGLQMPQLVIENGSGLSRIERVSARDLGQMLLTAYRSPVMPEFIASMPLVGVDGTMHRRLTNTPVVGQAHIKTGLLANVRAMAGYVLDAKGNRVVAIMLINHVNAPNANAVQDALLQWVHGR
jgi:D-alanyl-D-alanine carboxypeptidase/D-alanyl-D-alanine-endopeptidase (penicillin-binding protein 4)